MKFITQNYLIPDVPMKSFIDENEIWDFINNTESTKEEVQKVIAKSLSKQRLSW
jgi:hypothetical protein